MIEKEELKDEGWIPLFRKLLNSRVFQSEGLLKVWIWCLLKATWKERWVSVEVGRMTTEVHLQPGQFLFGRASAATELKMKPSTVWKRMQKLENMRNLNIQSNRHYSLVTLANWEFYQGLLKKGTARVTAEEQPRNRHQAESVAESGLPTPKKGKKDRKDIYAQDFLTFWDGYPNGNAKKAAYKAWQKLEKTEDMETLQVRILDALEKQKQAKELKKARGEFVPEWPHASTWLNGGRWEDEIQLKEKEDAWAHIPK